MILRPQRAADSEASYCRKYPGTGGRRKLPRGLRKPSHPCARSGCRTLVLRGLYCDLHKQPRPSAASQGYNFKWTRYSKTFLARNPFCCDPFRRHVGILKEATVTGHRTAHKGDDKLLWDPANHYPLCASCNAFQCVEYEGGFGREIQQPPPRSPIIAEQKTTQAESITYRANTGETRNALQENSHCSSQYSGSPLTADQRRKLSAERRKDSAALIATEHAAETKQTA